MIDILQLPVLKALGPLRIVDISVGFAGSMYLYLDGPHARLMMVLWHVDWWLYEMNDVITHSCAMYDEADQFSKTLNDGVNKIVSGMNGMELEDIEFDIEEGMLNIGIEGPYFIVARGYRNMEFRDETIFYIAERKGRKPGRDLVRAEVGEPPVLLISQGEGDSV